MSCSPFEATQTQLCVAGSSIFRIYKFHDNSLKMSHQTKVDKLIRCVSWVNDNRIVAGTKESRILVIEAGELMVEMTYQLPQAGLGIPSPEVSAIEAYDNGLLIGLDTGVVVSFRKTDDQYYYKKNREIALEEASVSQIALNPHDEMAVVTLKNNQIYKLTFEGDSQVLCLI
ncbi:hypothetical protein EDD86DRAFT_219376 [Gorgonomyces haynaldii]|nr:hypothetical protein EDD86DRAFT_219376 [Gorgonomyces haynaldii]